MGADVVRIENMAATHVDLKPALDDPAVREPIDADPADRHRLAGGRNAHQWPLVGPLPGPAPHHLVALRQDVLDRHLDVRQGGPESEVDLLEALTTGGLPGAGSWSTTSAANTSSRTSARPCPWKRFCQNSGFQWAV